MNDAAHGAWPEALNHENRTAQERLARVLADEMADAHEPDWDTVEVRDMRPRPWSDCEVGPPVIHCTFLARAQRAAQSMRRPEAIAIAGPGATAALKSMPLMPIGEIR